jgi:hypothetical protein
MLLNPQVIEVLKVCVRSKVCTRLVSSEIKLLQNKKKKRQEAATKLGTPSDKKSSLF